MWFFLLSLGLFCAFTQAVCSSNIDCRANLDSFCINGRCTTRECSATLPCPERPYGDASCHVSSCTAPANICVVSSCEDLGLECDTSLGCIASGEPRTVQTSDNNNYRGIAAGILIFIIIIVLILATVWCIVPMFSAARKRGRSLV